MNLEKAGKFTLVVFGVIGVILGIGLLMMLPTYFLWNWLMPTIFEIKKITLWQALGINLLAGILFGKISK